MGTEPADRPGRFHEVGFYRSDAEFGALIVPFVEEGVAAGQPVILENDDRKASLLRSWLHDPTTFPSSPTIACTPRQPGQSPPAGRCSRGSPPRAPPRSGIVWDVPHEGNGGRFAGWDRYESAVNTVWDQFPV